MRVVQEAERQAAAIRQQAESLAASVKRVGCQQADSLVGRAGDNPLLQAGAEVAAGELRQQTDQKAQGIISEASNRADSLVASAERQVTRWHSRVIPSADNDVIPSECEGSLQLTSLQGFSAARHMASVIRR